MDDTSSASATCDELRPQIELWHSSIPVIFRPELNIEASMQESNDRQSILRIRYFATRHMIYRPFAVFIVSRDVPSISHDIVKKAGIFMGIRYSVGSIEKTMHIFGGRRGEREKERE